MDETQLLLARDDLVRTRYECRFSPSGEEFAVTSEYDAADGTQEDLEFIRLAEVEAREHRKSVQIRDVVQQRHIPSASWAAWHPTAPLLALCTFKGVSFWHTRRRAYLGSLMTFSDRAGGMLVFEPYTEGEAGQVDLLGDPGSRPEAPLPSWAHPSMVTLEGGSLRDALLHLVHQEKPVTVS